MWAWVDHHVIPRHNMLRHWDKCYVIRVTPGWAKERRIMTRFGPGWIIMSYQDTLCCDTRTNVMYLGLLQAGLKSAA